MLKNLVITPGEKVWFVFIDIHVLDYDGNLFDAASLGALAALSTTIVPAKRFGEQLPEEYPKEDFPLPMSEPPISCTAVKINDFVLFDPCFDEEVIADVRLTVATDHNGDIRAMQKGLSGSFSKEEIQKVIKGALDNGQEIRKKAVTIEVQGNNMSKRTKKVGTSGRFAERYGVKSRTMIREVESQQKLRHACPRCGQKAVQRNKHQYLGMLEMRQYLCWWCVPPYDALWCDC